jgi:hypothetical protein
MTSVHRLSCKVDSLMTADDPTAVANALDHNCGTAALCFGPQRHEGERALCAILSKFCRCWLLCSMDCQNREAGIQELLDDVRRHKSDSVVNHRLVTVLRASGEVQARWQDLRVGDIIKVAAMREVAF